MRAITDRDIKRRFETRPTNRKMKDEVYRAEKKLRMHMDFTLAYYRHAIVGLVGLWLLMALYLLVERFWI